MASTLFGTVFANKRKARVISTNIKHPAFLTITTYQALHSLFKTAKKTEEAEDVEERETGADGGGENPEEVSNAKEARLIREKMESIEHGDFFESRQSSEMERGRRDFGVGRGKCAPPFFGERAKEMLNGVLFKDPRIDRTRPEWEQLRRELKRIGAEERRKVHLQSTKKPWNGQETGIS